MQEKKLKSLVKNILHKKEVKHEAHSIKPGYVEAILAALIILIYINILFLVLKEIFFFFVFLILK